MARENLSQLAHPPPFLRVVFLLVVQLSLTAPANRQLSKYVSPAIMPSHISHPASLPFFKLPARNLFYVLSGTTSAWRCPFFPGKRKAGISSSLRKKFSFNQVQIKPYQDTGHPALAAVPPVARVPSSQPWSSPLFPGQITVSFIQWQPGV